MELINMKCEKCKGHFLTKNEIGIHYCPLCECKNELYIFPVDFTGDQVIKANQLFKDVRKLFRKHDIEQSNIEIMDLVVLTLTKGLKN